MDSNIRQLACAIVLQAVKDFAEERKPEKRQQIIKELRSSRMDFITNGTSTVVAEELEKHPKEIIERLKKNSEVEI